MANVVTKRERGSVNVTYRVEGPVGLVVLDRPEKLNAFTFRMVEEIRSVVDEAAADPNVVAVVITGNGRGFSAGLDTGDLAKSASGTVASSSRAADPDELPALFSHIMRVPKPVIAAVNGVAAGGGFVLAMMCDLSASRRRARPSRPHSLGGASLPNTARAGCCLASSDSTARST